MKRIKKEIKKLQNVNLKKIKIHKASIFERLESLKFNHYWMFFDNELTNIEILFPDLETINQMKKHGLVFVVKKIKSPCEFKILDKLRYHLGFYTMMYFSKCVESQLMVNAFVSFINNSHFPSQDEIQKSIIKNKLVCINQNDNATKIIEKEKEKRKQIEKYKKLREKYFLLTHRKIQKFIKQNRVTILENIL